jgi:PAS domain S-box-containing protein
MSGKPTYKELEQRVRELEHADFELKRTEKALLEIEKRYNLLIQRSQTGIYIHVGGLLKFVNNRFAEMMGYAPNEMVGRQYWDFVHPEDKEMVKEISLARARGEAAPPEYDFRHQGKNGETVWVHNLPTIVQYQGQTANMGNLVQINDRKQAEERLRKSEEKYRTIMEAFVEPLCICSHDFIIEYMNPAMIRRIGRDATGETCYSALHGIDSKCDWCAFDKVMQDDRTETTIRSPLDDRQYRISNMPIENKDGTISEMTIYRDITDYLAAVSEKEKAQAQLIHAQKMESIGNLAGGIAHDFNNILATIIGFTELVMDDVEKDSVIEDNLQGIFSAGKRAKDLVGQILAFARQSEEKVKPIRVDKIIEEVLRFMRSSLPTTIEIKKKIDSESLIMGNETQLHQIMMNLCTNAAHAMEEKGGVLDVSLTDIEMDWSIYERLDLKPGHYIEINAIDTGTGIPPHIIDSIFEPYFTTKEPGEGTGMGLATVHGIVESYGGKIVVKSDPGKGTAFTIYLPITRKRRGLRQYKSGQLPTGTERILIVDDEALIANMSSQILERLGYAVTTRTSSVEAYELFKSRPNDFDLVITDMTMPNMTGDKLATELMRIRSNIPIVLCTGYSTKISEEIALQIGVRAFAYKPIVKADLAKTIRKVLDEDRTNSFDQLSYH